MRKIIAMLLALVMALGLVACGNNTPAETTAPGTTAPAETQPAETQAQFQGTIAILYTNDVHTYIDGVLSYDVIAALKADLANQYDHVLLVDAGDHAQGTAYGSMDKGETIINLMNAAGYDLATLGNHEFDYGMEGRINITDNWANFPYVSCNFYHEKDGVKGETVLPAYVMFEFGTEKVAFIGITTPESFTKSTPAYFQDETGTYIYGISGGEDGAALYADVQTAMTLPRPRALPRSSLWATWATISLPSPGPPLRPLPTPPAWMLSSTATPTPPWRAPKSSTRMATPFC